MGEAKTCLFGTSVLVVLILAISLIATSLRKLETDEVGLMYNVPQKTLSKTPRGTGLYSGPPGFKFIKYSSVFTNLHFPKVDCVDKNGIEIKLIVQLQYRAKREKLYDITMQFEDSEHYVKLLKNVASSAIHDACSRFNTTQFQTNRSDFQALVVEQMQGRFGNVSSDVTDLQVQNIERPDEYEKVIRKKESAKENIKIARNKRPRKLIQASTKKEEAKRKAEVTIQEAETDAKVILAKARAEAAGILAALEAESSSLRKVMDDQGLDVNGVLSYLATRVIDDNPNKVSIGFDPPAKTKFF